MPRGNVRRLASFVGALLLVAVVAAGRPVWAAQIDPMPLPQDTARLKASIEERWRVIPLQGGLLLVPRRPSTPIKGIELTRDTIAIDGQTVTGADLQNRLGTDAEAVLRLSYLSPSDRAQLFRADSEPPLERGGSASRGASAGSTSRAAAPPIAAAPATPSETGNTTNAPWTEVMPIARGDRIRIGGDATVDESEQVRSLVAVLGSADVKGLVAKDVFAVGGDVRLGPKAVVRGSVMTVGGRIHADPGARVGGEVTELSLASSNLRIWGGHDGDFNVAITPDWPRIARIAFGTGLIFSLCWFVLCAGALVVLPGGVARAREGIAFSPLGAFVVGLATQVLFMPAMLLIATALSISVIGIPLLAAIPLAVFGLFIASLLGFTGVLVAIGERFVGRSLPMLALLAGALLAWGVGLGGRYLWMMNGGAFGVGFALAIIGLAIEYIAMTFGLGGALLAWTLARRRAATAPHSQITPATPSEPSPSGVSLDI
jgi:hypothetical protein